MSQDCPVDHLAAEQKVESLPGPIRRAVYLTVGGVSVVMGVIGMVVPLWPTTCFLLLAAWAFARSSPRAERWLHENRLFGKYLAAYRENGVIPPRVRRTTVITMWAFMALAVILVDYRLWVAVLLALIGTGVTAHLYSLPSAPAEQEA